MHSAWYLFMQRWRTSKIPCSLRRSPRRHAVDHISRWQGFFADNHSSDRGHSLYDYLVLHRTRKLLRVFESSAQIRHTEFHKGNWRVSRGVLGPSLLDNWLTDFEEQLDSTHGGKCKLRTLIRTNTHKMAHKLRENCRVNTACFKSDRCAEHKVRRALGGQTVSAGKELIRQS